MPIQVVRDGPVAMHLAVGTPDRRTLAGVPDRVLAAQVTLSSG